MILLRQLKLFHSHRDAVCQAGTSGVFSPMKCCPDLLKNPGVAKDAAPDHQAVGPGALQAANRRVSIRDIAVGNHRDRQLLLDLVNHIPVGSAGIEHTAGAPVDGYHGRAAVLHSFGKVQHVDAALVPAKAAFHGDRDIHRLHHRFHDFPRQLRGTHQTAAVAGIGHLGHGTAHVDVQKITAGDFQRQHRGPGHDLRVVAENLRAADAAFVFPKELDAFLVLIHQRPGGHHFRHGHVRSQPGADGAEGPVRDPGHGGKEQRILQFYVAKFHGFLSFIFHSGSDYSTAYPDAQVTAAPSAARSAP